MNFLPKAAIGVGLGLMVLSIDKLFNSSYSQLIFLAGFILIGFGKMFDLILKQNSRTDNLKVELNDKIKELDKGLDALRVWSVEELEKKK